ncbi:DUF3606 domain-containing protein [Beijerinckia sp. L45]|uniref:DUF3606 domain-containing protein n=1 Tax=Beijerinckia sp. L45 TaxID=1641855 RepID=UPI00131BFAC8|nr:DUF3606 domain-containing protein [Beijerinckia sp. L45]
MSDDKTKTGTEDRRTVAGDEPYEVSYFAKKHGLTHEEAQGLIAKFGNVRATLDAEADRLKLDRASVSPVNL